MSLSNCGLTTRVLSEHENSSKNNVKQQQSYCMSEAEEEEDEENIDLYRSPRNNTYSLADFVKENYTMPVILKRPKSILSLSDNLSLSEEENDTLNKLIDEKLAEDASECFGNENRVC